MEAIRRKPWSEAPWDGVAEIRPFGAMEKKIVEGLLIIMRTTPHLPCLRLGQPYQSLNHSEVIDYRDGTNRATLSQVNPGVIRRI